MCGLYLLTSLYRYRENNISTDTFTIEWGNDKEDESYACPYGGLTHMENSPTDKDVQEYAEKYKHIFQEDPEAFIGKFLDKACCGTFIFEKIYPNV